MGLPFPLILLLIAFGSILVYQRVSNEIWRVLAAGTAIVCLIWGFAIAHWSIHLLSLVFLLRFNRLGAILRTDSSR